MASKKGRPRRLTEYQGMPVIPIMYGKFSKPYIMRHCNVCTREYLASVNALRYGRGLTCSIRCGNFLRRGQTEHRRNKKGYILLYRPEHPFARKEKAFLGFVYEHRLVVEKKIGRLLRRNEVVHHLNGKKWDNREENLEVMTAQKHARIHGKRGYSPCRFCGKI